MLLNVQNYLLTHSLTQLEADYGVKHRIHGHKVSLNYSQIEAKEGCPIADECRGLVISKRLYSVIVPNDVFGDSVIMALPFKRFYNLGQGSAASVDLNASSTRFFEKLDGTLCILYYDTHTAKWCVATRSVPEADLPIDGFDTYTFRTLFERAIFDTLHRTVTDLACQLSIDNTYMFELTTPVNQVVVKYNDYRVALLGVRNRYSVKEIDAVEVAYNLGLPRPQTYSFGSLKDMVDFVSSRNPQEHEGIVVCDANFNRVKVKNPAYLALNRIKDSAVKSPRALIELILLQKLDDTLCLLPEHVQTRALSLQDATRSLFKSYGDTYWDCLEQSVNAACDAPTMLQVDPKFSRKAFALAVQAHPNGWLTPMMLQYTGKIKDLADWIEKSRLVDGSWSHSFLDAFLERVENMGSH